MSEVAKHTLEANQNEPSLSQEERDLVDSWLRLRETDAKANTHAIPVRSNRGSARASVGQEQIWLHANLAGSKPVYVEPVTVHYSGKLDVDALRRSLAEFVQRHSAWRTTFEWQEGELCQIIKPQVHVPLPYSDLSSLTRSERERRALKLATYDAFAPFDLARGPLLRWRLIRLSEDEHRIYVTLHHIIFDGVSLYKIFLPELAAMYRANSLGGKHGLPKIAIDYPDYAEWHRTYTQGESVTSQLGYWESTLANLPELDIQPDHARGEIQSYRGSMERFRVPLDIVESLKQVAKSTNATLFMVLTAVITVLLKHRVGSEDIPIGSAASGRKWSETENVVGYFLNTIVLRIDAAGDPSFLKLVERVRETTIAALSRDEVPFSMVLKRVASKRDASRHPLFQVVFSLEPPLGELETGWKFTQMDVETGMTKFDLHLEMDERSDGIWARFIYNADLFEKQTILDMAKVWLQIAECAARSPELRISGLVPGAQKKRLMSRIKSFFGAGPIARASRAY